MQFPWFRRRRKRRAALEQNPFTNRITLAKFLGTVAADLINGQISEKEARATERLVADFYRLLTFKDFSFEALDAITPESDRVKLSYST